MIEYITIHFQEATTMSKLTKYQLACGYIQKTNVSGLEITLWHEHSHYHIRLHNFNSHKRVFWISSGDYGDFQRKYARAVKLLEKLAAIMIEYVAEENRCYDIDIAQNNSEKLTELSTKIDIDCNKLAAIGNTTYHDVHTAICTIDSDKIKTKI